MPRIFLSELRVEELSEKALEYQEKYIERKKKEAKESQASHE